jgi:hypothetical protein
MTPGLIEPEQTLLAETRCVRTVLDVHFSSLLYRKIGIF